jgi:hypothetical protein
VSAGITSMPGVGAYSLLAIGRCVPCRLSSGDPRDDEREIAYV